MGQGSRETPDLYAMICHMLMLRARRKTLLAQASSRKQPRVNTVRLEV